jgi:hypothetical protein
VNDGYFESRGNCRAFKGDVHVRRTSASVRLDMEKIVQIGGLAIEIEVYCR